MSCQENGWLARRVLQRESTAPRCQAQPLLRRRPPTSRAKRRRRMARCRRRRICGASPKNEFLWERGGPSLPSLYARRLTEAAAVTKALQIHVRVPAGPRTFAHKPNEATQPCVGAAAFPVGSDWRRRILRPRPARLFGICRRRLRNPARAAAIDAPGLVLQPFHGARAPALPEPLDVNLTR